MEYETYFDRISERAVGRYDVSALFDDYRVFDAVIADFVEPFRERDIDAVAGIDALGFVLGTGVAMELAVGFHPIRKGGKLPIPDDDRIQQAVTDYTGEEKCLELDAARVTPGLRVLVVDDWMETGAQMDAATSLVKQAGGTVAGIAVLDCEQNDRSRAIATEYDLHTVNPDTSL